MNNQNKKNSKQLLKPEALLNILEDLEDKRKKLAESEEKYRALVETSPDCIKLLDKNGDITFMSSGGLKEHRFKTMNQAMGWNWKNSVIKEHQPKVEQALKDALAGKTTTFEVKHTPQGSIRDWCIMTISPIKGVTGKITNIFAVSRDITERKKTEEELRLNSEITKNLTEGIYLVGLKDVIIKYTNPKFEEMFGYGSGEMVGKHASIVNAQTKKYPQETAKEIMKEIHKTGEWHGEVLNKKKDGTIFWSYANVSIMTHERYGKVLVAVHTDITERKMAEQRLKDSEKIFEDLYENAPDAYQSFGPTGIYVNVNKTWLKKFGYSKKEVIGKKKFSDLILKSQIKQFKEHLAKLNHGKDVKDTEYVVKKKDGSFMPVIINATGVYNKQGKFIMSRAILRDITAQKKVEHEIKQANIKLKQANKITNQFASIVAHELKVPSNFIINDAEFIYENYLKDLTPEVKKKIDMILKNSKHLRRTIKQILTMTRAEVKRGLLIENFDLNKLINEIVKLGMVPIAKKRNIGIRLNLKSIPRINAERNKITEVINNLVDNAVKYTNEGGIIDVQSFAKGKNIVVKIKDTGIGIAKENISKLFKKFYVVNKKAGGTGLGLATIKNIIEQHHGRVGVTSTLGKGSIFWFEIPVGEIKKVNKKV